MRDMSEPVMFDDLHALKVPVDDLSEHPENYNRGDTELIAESLRANGQYKPIIFDKATGHVLAGNHTLRAARTLGWQAVAAIGIDTDPATARKILAVDNQSARKSTFDEALLADLLGALPDLEGTGFTDSDLDDLLAANEAPVELPPTPTEADWAETPEQTQNRAQQAESNSSYTTKGVAEVILVLELDAKESLLRDLDAIAVHCGVDTRAAAATSAGRIALAVLDAADTNPELRRIVDLAEAAGPEAAPAAA